MAYFIDVLRPSAQRAAWVFDGAAIIGGSLLIALLAQFEIPIGPIPFTLQLVGILLVGGLLGSKRGTLALLAYLTEGAMGLPVFSGGGAGVAWFLGSQGGYFLGFIICAYVVGALLERGWKEKYGLILLAMTLGSALVLIVGAAWLSFFVGVASAFKWGVLPFLIGDMAKIVMAASIVSSGRKVVRRLQG